MSKHGIVCSALYILAHVGTTVQDGPCVTVGLIRRATKDTKCLSERSSIMQRGRENMARLYKWICTNVKRHCETIVVAHHRPRVCPACGSASSLMFPAQIIERERRRLKLPRLRLRYLKCRKCDRVYSSRRKLKHCSCGHTKFATIKYEEFSARRSEQYRAAVGRPKRGAIPDVAHFSNEKKRSHRRTVHRRRQ